jgi:hypothetical protein
LCCLREQFTCDRLVIARALRRVGRVNQSRRCTQGQGTGVGR